MCQAPPKAWIPCWWTTMRTKPPNSLGKSPGDGRGGTSRNLLRYSQQRIENGRTKVEERLHSKTQFYFLQRRRSFRKLWEIDKHSRDVYKTTKSSPSTVVTHLSRPPKVPLKSQYSSVSAHKKPFKRNLLVADLGEWPLYPPSLSYTGALPLP